MFLFLIVSRAGDGRRWGTPARMCVWWFWEAVPWWQWLPYRVATGRTLAETQVPPRPVCFLCGLISDIDNDTRAHINRTLKRLESAYYDFLAAGVLMKRETVMLPSAKIVSAKRLCRQNQGVFEDKSHLSLDSFLFCLLSYLELRSLEIWMHLVWK